MILSVLQSVIEWALCAIGAHVPPEYARRPECLGWACVRCGEWRRVAP